MDEKKELIKLTIENISVVEQSFQLLEEADGVFLYDFIGKLPQYINEGLPGWEFADFEDDWAFWPPEWCIAMKNSALKAFFVLGQIGESDAFWLSVFAGVNGNEAGIKFKVDRKLYKSSANRIEATINNFFFRHEAELRAANFKFSEDMEIYHPLKLDLNLIASEYPDLGPNVFEPFKAALEDIKAVFPLFDGYFKEITGK